MNVPVGRTTTWSATVVAVLAIITTLGVVWDDLRAKLEAAGVPPEWTARAGVIIGLAVVVGRYGQSIAGVWGRESGPGTGDVVAPPDDAAAPTLPAETDSPGLPGRELDPDTVE
jgi:hypothetical protein